MKKITKLWTRLTPYQPREQIVAELYSLLGRSLPALFIFIIFLAYFLYDSIGEKIIWWSVGMTSIVFFRFLTLMLFRLKTSLLQIDQWYKLFVVLSISTVLGLLLLNAVYFPAVSDFEKLFIITAMVGVTSGAHASLSPDIRLMVFYISAILIPLIVATLSSGIKIFIAIGVMLALYLLTLLFVALNSLKLKREIQAKHYEVKRTKEALLEEKERLQYFYTQAPVPIFSYDLQLFVTDCNDAMLELFDAKKEEIVGIDLTTLPNRTPYNVATEALETGKCSYTGPYESRNGMKLWVEARAFALHNKDGDAVGGIIMFEDKTKERHALEELRHMAQHDPLTSLYNRRAFRHAMVRLVKTQKHQQYYSGVFYLDLNRFKYINDTLGHHFGDKLLVEVAKRIKSITRQSDIVARLGGDEFVIVTPFVDTDEEKAKVFCESFARRIQDSFEPVFIIDDIRLYLQTSIGVVLIKPGETDTEEIVRHADISMYQAKHRSNKHIAFYDTTLDHLRKTSFQLQQDLMQALRRGDFTLHFQPIVSSKDHLPFAAEALIRWKHPHKGLLLPAEFLPLAVELGIITEIGDWVIQEAFRTVAEWKRLGVWNLEYLSINVDAKQLVQDNFFERFTQQLHQYGIRPNEVTIEVTENSLIDNFERTNEVLGILKKCGVRCTIDDFGTGYSSLSYLKKLAFSILKIDKAFTEEMLEENDNIGLIKTFINIAQEFRYDIIFEGIEYPIQLQRLQDVGKVFGYQGYLISKPVSKEEFKKRFLLR